MKTSETITKIAPAFLKSQQSIESVIKDSTNPYFKSKYADLTAVIEACKDKLNKNGIMILQPINGLEVETILIHESGEWFSSTTPVVCKAQNDPQALGSAITYAKRYGLQSMVLLPAEDDDANLAAPAKEPNREVARPYYSQSEAKIINPILCSEKQIQLISILLQQKGQRDEDLKSKYRVVHKRELSKVQASQIIDNLSKLPDVEYVDPAEVQI